MILHLKPYTAMKHCYEIFKNAEYDYADNGVKHKAYYLLRDVFDCRKITPPDPDAEWDGEIMEMGVVDLLMLSQFPNILESAAKNHPDEYLCSQAKQLLILRGDTVEQGLFRAGIVNSRGVTQAGRLSREAKERICFEGISK